MRIGHAALGAPSMRKILAILVIGMCGVATRGEEPPQLDFAQKLRASHYPDLALEYLEKLAKTAPAELKPGIELEIARSRLDIARSEPDAAKKPALLAQARAGFETFVKNNPNRPEAAEAKLEITSLAVLQGRTQLRKAMRPTSGGKQAETLKARAALDDAAKQLEIGVKELDLKLVKYDEAKSEQELKEKKALQEAKLKAELERGTVLLEEAQTYAPNGSTEAGKQRAEIIKQALAVLDKVVAATD